MERRLAAILLTDMVDYSRLMGLDEEGTIARQKAHRAEIFDPKIAEHSGRIVKATGDGLLVEFPSVVDAVKCAVSVQQDIAQRDGEVSEGRRIRYRIGINLGDIVIDDDDILGDGVNVAARLEALAKPGGICISGAVYDQLAGKVDVAFEDLGEQTVKNVPRAVRVWRWDAISATRGSDARDNSMALPDRPSIAVLPFVNRSSDPDQEFLADGMAEDIAAGLSKFRWLFVIARQSSFAFKGKLIGIGEVAKQLGVRYVLEGSIRGSGNRIRVTVQLIDAVAGNQLWTERYDRDLEDIFSIQDEITGAIVGAIAPEISNAEVERVRRTPPDSLDAWGLYQKGLALYPSGEEEAFKSAIGFFDRAREADPAFADAIVMAAHIRTRYVIFHKPDHHQVLLDEAHALLQSAMGLDYRNAECFAALGRNYRVQGKHELALSMCRQAVDLNPNSVMSQQGLGVALTGLERFEEAIEHAVIARQLSPRDPQIAATYTLESVCLYRLGRYEECVQACKMALASPNRRYWSYVPLIAALHRLDGKNELNSARDELLALKPDFKISYLENYPTLHLDEVQIALREVGIPE